MTKRKEKRRRERKVQCEICGAILTERKIKKYNREHNYCLNYMPPCPYCGSNCFIQILPDEENKVYKIY